MTHDHQKFQVPEMEVLNLKKLFWGVGFPYIARIHTSYIGQDSSNKKVPVSCLVTWLPSSWGGFQHRKKAAHLLFSLYISCIFTFRGGQTCIVDCLAIAQNGKTRKKSWWNFRVVSKLSRGGSVWFQDLRGWLEIETSDIFFGHPHLLSKLASQLADAKRWEMQMEIPPLPNLKGLPDSLPLVFSVKNSAVKRATKIH